MTSIFVATGLCLSACDLPPEEQAKIGATIGALAGYASGNTSQERRDRAIAGAVIGAGTGYLMGRYFTSQDRKIHTSNASRALRSGQTQTWKNPSTNAGGVLIPIGQPNYSGPGCARFKTREFVDGRLVADKVLLGCHDQEGKFSTRPA